MFSKTTTGLTIMLGAYAVLASGCFFAQDPPPPKLIGDQIGSFKSSCLKEMSKGIGNYFAGNLQDDKQIADIWDCGASALTEVKLLVRGAQPNIIPAVDFVAFLNTYLPAQDKISDGLRVSAMTLKVAFLGGDANNLNFAELDKTIEIIGILKRGSQAIKLLMPMTPAHIDTLSQSTVSGIMAALEGAGTELGVYVSAHGGNYSFDDANQLLVEFQSVYMKNADPGNPVRWIIEQMPVLRSLKAIVVGGSPDNLIQSEWSRALTLASQVYGTYILYSNESSRNGASWFTQPGIDALAQIVSRGVDHLVAIGANHDGGIVPAALINTLVTTLQTTKANPDPNMASIATTISLADFTAKALVAKQALFGGIAYSLDLNRAAELKPFVESIKNPAYRAYQILVQTDFSNITDIQWNKILADFETSSLSAVAALEALQADAPPISFDTFTALTVALDPLFTLEATRTSIDNTVTLAKGAKAVFLGAPYQQILQKDWNAILEQGARLAGVYLRTLRQPAAPVGGGLSSQQLDYLWSIADSATAALNAAVQSHPAGSQAILISEIQTLLNGLPNSFANKNAIIALLPGALGLKQALFGGDGQSLAASDLLRLQILLSTAKTQSYILRSYFPIDFTQIGTWTNERIDSLAAAFNTAAVQLAGTLGTGTTTPYAFADLDTFLSKMSPLLTDPTMITNAREALPVLSGFKAVFVRPTYDSVQPGEWKELVTTLGNWGAVGLRILHFSKQAPDWYQGPALLRMRELAGLVLQNLRAATLTRTPAEINFLDLDRFFASLYTVAQNHNIAVPMQLSTLQNFLRPGVRKLMSGANFTATGHLSNGISTAAVDLTSARLLAWGSGQNTLQEAFLSLNPDPAVLNSLGFPRPVLADALAKFHGVAKLETILTNFRPLFSGTDRHLMFLYDNAKENLYSFNDLSRKWLYSFMSQALIDGYVSDPVAAAQGLQINAADFQTFVVDIHFLIANMKFGPQDLPDATLATQRFFEANVFTSQSNGDTFLQVPEVTEYIAFLGSTKALAAPIWDNMLANCPNGGPDVYGDPMVPIQCFRDRFFDVNNFAANFQSAFPKMVETFQGLNAAGRVTFMQDLEIAARAGLLTEKPIDTYKAENFITILSYVESLFKRFDALRNGELYMQEALGAFPLVCSKLQAVSGLPGSCAPRWGLLESLFGYMLVFGTVPQKAGPNFFDKILVGIEFLAWSVRWAGIRHCTHCSYRVDRPRILQVIEAMAANPQGLGVDYSNPAWGQ